MKYSNKILSSICTLTIILLFTACSKPKTVHLTADLSVLNAKEVIINNGVYTINDTIALVDGRLDHSLPLEHEQVLTLSIGNAAAQVYVVPDSKLDFSYNPTNKEFSFAGNTSLENITIGITNKLIKEANSEFAPLKIVANGEHEFVEKLNEKYNKVKEYIELQRPNIAPSLFEKLVNRINSASATDMLRFPTYYEYANKSKVVLTQGYEEQINQISVDDPDMLEFPEGVSLGRAMVEKGIDFNDFGTVGKYYVALIDQVNNTFTNPQMREYFKFLYLKEKIGYAGGLDGIENHIESFYASAKNQDFVNALKKEASQWIHLRKGLEAPDFSGITREGSVVNLSELKGKNIYVDVWATWCGPCIREIPALKEIEHDYKGKNLTFVSISIDKAKDKEKWENFIDEKGLGGTQLFAQGDWNSDVTRNYNINGIPRFLLIDASGKIVMADAPRPSSPYLREVLTEMGI